MPRDYYEILGLDRDAGDSDIKKAFRGLARELHPDVNRHDPAAEERFKEVAEAYEVLKDPERRATYDRFGHAGLRSSGWEPSFASFGSFADVFQAFFGGSEFESIFGGRPGGGPTRGGDLAAEVEVTLEEVATGVSKRIELDLTATCLSCHGNGAEPGTPIETCPRCGGAGQLEAVTRTVFGQVVRRAICDRCRGEGKVASTPCGVCSGRGQVAESTSVSVDVPAGIENGQQIRLSGRGHAGSLGGPSGDIYVVVHVLAHERFERSGRDLVAPIEVPFTDAALGATVEVPTLGGSERMELEPGLQPGAVLRLRGKGLPALRGRGHGDLHVVVNVMVPRNLTDPQRELLSRFAESANGGNYPSSDDRGRLFDRIKQAFRA